MAIGKGSRVELKGPEGKMIFGLVFKASGGTAQVMADDGRGLRCAVAGLKETGQPIPKDHPSRKFVARDRISFGISAFDGIKEGTVVKIDRFGLMEVLADDGEQWQGVNAAKAEVSTKPAPANAARIVKHAKGDRVEFTHKKELLYGVVSKVGPSRIEVTQDGGVVVHSGGASAFRPSTQPLKVGGPDDMDRWSVSSYKFYPSMSEETNCFEAVISLDGKKVIAASNRGHGGSDDMHAMQGAPHDVVSRLDADAKAWVKRFDSKVKDEKYSEDASAWLDWAVNKKPYGVPAGDYFDRNNEAVEEMESKPFSPFRS